MSEKKIYKTLRISFNDEMKLFPSWKIEGIDDLKQKVIMRFDMTWRKNDFELQFTDQQSHEVLVLKDVPDMKKIDGRVIDMLINNKITLIVKKRKSNQINTEKIIQIENQEPLCDKQHKNDKHYVQCDHCMQFPIIGIRFKCLVCKNFDLCSQCYLKLQQKAQQKCHPYIKIRNPIEKINQIEVCFEDTEIIKMSFSCQKLNLKQLGMQSKFAKQVDQECLPQKFVSGRNFVEKIYNESVSRRYCNPVFHS